jgi:hypothetical protein
MLKTSIFLSAAILIVCSLASSQQSKAPLSPPAHAQCKFSEGKTITVDYASPRVRNRKIFGALVPYGEVWRTGANSATTFEPTADVTVGGKDVPAGKYTIFTVPAQDKWTLIINKHTGESGIPYKYESEELGRVPMQVSKTSAPVENFTISFDQSGGACTMRMSWESTQASVQISEKK